MMPRPRLILAAASVALTLVVVATGVALGPDQFRRWLVFSGVLAVVTSIQSVASDQRDLTAALLLSTPPVVALLADGSPTWLIGPLAVLLLIAAELSALSWDARGVRGGSSLTHAQRQRLLDIAPLALLGFAGSVVVGAAAMVAVPGGTLAVGLAAIALAVLGRTVFRRAG